MTPNLRRLTSQKSEDLCVTVCLSTSDVWRVLDVVGIMCQKNCNDADKRRAKEEGKELSVGRSVCLSGIGFYVVTATCRSPLWSCDFICSEFVATQNNGNRTASCEINVPFLTCCDLPTYVLENLRPFLIRLLSRCRAVKPVTKPLVCSSNRLRVT